MRQPDALFAEDAGLEQDVLDGMPGPPANLVETVLVAAPAQQPDQLPGAPAKDAKRHQG